MDRDGPAVNAGRIRATPTRIHEIREKTMRKVSVVKGVSLLALALGCSQMAAAQTVESTDLEDDAQIPADEQQPSSSSPENARKTTEAAAANDVIIVTANRREQSLADVGVTVTAVSAAQLVDRGITSPEDLVKVVPGFQASPTYGGSPNYTLRGVGFAARYASAISPIGLYLNEAAVPYPYMSLGLLHDLERVEVLKGPQGTLYGRNATGGLINYVSAKPTATPQGGFRVEAGSYDTLNVSTFGSGPISDSVRVRLALSSENRFEGWQRSVTRNERLGELHQHAARLSFNFGNGGPFELDLQADYWKKTGDTQAPQAIAFTPTVNQALLTQDQRDSIIANPTDNRDADFLSPTRQPAARAGIFSPPPIVDSRFYMVTARASLELSDSLSLASLTSYSDLRSREVSDAAGLQTQSIYQDSRNDIDSLSQEIRLLSDMGRLQWSIGGYYARDNALTRDRGYSDENAVIRGLRLAALQLNPLTGNRYTPDEILNGFPGYRNRADFDTEVIAGFANLEYEFTDRLTLIAGGRYTRDSVDFEGCTFDTDGQNVPVVNPVYTALFGTAFDLQPNQCYVLNETNTGFVPTIQQSQKEDNFAWRATLEFEPNLNTLVYATVSRGFKAGGFPVIAGSSIRQFDPVEQEQLTNYELGAKLGLFDGRVQWNLSGFYYDYRNKQIFGRTPDVVFGTLSLIDNIPRSYEYGVESDITARLGDYVNFQLAALYVKSEIEEYDGFTETGAPRDFSGRPFAFTPEFQGSASINYEGPISSAINLYASVAGSYQSSSQADFDGNPLFRIDDYALVDATLGIAAEDGDWRLGAYATNLFDTYYWNSASSATETIYRYAGMPREIGIRYSASF